MFIYLQSYIIILFLPSYIQFLRLLLVQLFQKFYTESFAQNI